jgi:hypothetical protein
MPRLRASSPAIALWAIGSACTPAEFVKATPRSISTWNAGSSAPEWPRCIQRRFGARSAVPSSFREASGPEATLKNAASMRSSVSGGSTAPDSSGGVITSSPSLVARPSRKSRRRSAMSGGTRMVGMARG